MMTASQHINNGLQHICKQQGVSQLLLTEAVKAIKENHRSLLPVGVKAVEGHFERGDVVECVDIAGNRIAVGRVNFSSRSAEIVKRFIIR